ncbi:MAG: hypothetical protein H6806_11065 [Planctomycetes bacterium]|nr:hypothetical protein [Myxococcales bacterium]MCB9508288.1 hypothetical protein [Myxococcales bacterium]MCB9830285.1 hypothetical protein [Planctomycetota bacterium]
MSKPETTYFVDNEPQTTDQRDLTVRQILTNSGNDPETHYLVEIKGDHQVDHRNLDESLHIHENEKFAAIFTGTTPVS